MSWWTEDVIPEWEDFYPEGRNVTSASNYTHVHCADCGALLHCSEAEPFKPQDDYGWCLHQPEGEFIAVFTDMPDDTMTHRCAGGKQT